MTQIDFHYLNTSDKLLYTCRLLRKALNTTPSIVVTGQTEQLAAMDSMLWQFSAEDFFGHHWLQQPAADTLPPYLMQYARVWLTATHLPCLRPHLLVNLSDNPLIGIGSYERMVELVTAEEADLAKAQERSLYYAECGHNIVRHNVRTRS